MFVNTQRLDYADHSDEIASLNAILAPIQAMKPFPPELQPTVEAILDRLNLLQLGEKAVLSLYDQREERR